MSSQPKRKVIKTVAGRVEDKVAFITGAARGQGRAHAVRLAEEGADIIAFDACAPIETVDYAASTPSDLAETVRSVEALGRKIVPVQGDVRNFEQVRQGVEEGVAALGRLDVVVANAGILTMAPAHEWTEIQWQTMIDVNLTGVWHTAKATIPTLIEQGEGGSIIATSSTMGLKAAAGAIGYVAAKFGVTGIVKNLAHELGPHRIRVNSLHPTNVATEMLDNAMVRKAFRPDLENPTFEDAVNSYSVVNIWDMPWVETIDVANALLWLASDEARYVTGAALPVDLGASAK
ncbi:mycofactocin-coupled SDR family oxidoreductase [Rhodococcus sp. IEGM 1305]|uniref:mycofactocin-coupled SDR family oxidoreductase n=1 Tax=Rhodococcus sp. IEGM 1305 TaxID=3047092 RepID=UPI0024B7041B|nr:mycofactocin-coupled SDR family oxidoreductase [Rhodococcus sp. IEGM 1305]MDI9953628.1 mycofactocin-coupled SDR family oxidoreductase [Rhodococcus sp. IEGM 1305]